jgi:two-component system LytT family response regulator
MRNKFKSLIIDDENLAREDLKALLEDIDEVEVIGEAETVDEARKLIKSMDHDLIFLDIQMPGKSGFDLLKEIETKAHIIFVTAFDEYAIRAFDVNAQDYLLKPVDKKRLQSAIERLTTNKEIIDRPKKIEYTDHIFILANNTHQFIKMSNIIKITSAGNYSEIETKYKFKGLVYKSLKEWENKLPDKNFARIHRNAIINLEYVERVEEWFNSSFRVYMKNVDKPLIMSRRYATSLKNRMG